MKKSAKLTALVLSFVLLLTAVGGTLAYLTAQDSQQNIFTVGNIAIRVDEKSEVTNGKTGNDKIVYEDRTKILETGTVYQNIMPGNTIIKQPTVTNIGNNAAYVRVVVHMNNRRALANLLKKYVANGNYQDNDIFDGWNFQYAAVDGMFFTNTLSEGKTYTNGDGKIATLLYVDEAIRNEENGCTYVTKSNHFHTDAENDLSQDGFTIAKKSPNRIKISHSDLSEEVKENPSDYIYYQDLVGVGKNDGVSWIYYLKMEPGSSVTLFNGINVLGDFDEDDLALFKDLEINVCADAIQVEGFDSVDDAVIALNKTHPLSDWKLG